MDLKKCCCCKLRTFAFCYAIFLFCICDCLVLYTVIHQNYDNIAQKGLVISWHLLLAVQGVILMIACIKEKVFLAKIFLIANVIYVIGISFLTSIYPMMSGIVAVLGMPTITWFGVGSYYNELRRRG